MTLCKRFFVLIVAVLFFSALIPTTMAEEVQKININTASVEELAQLKRIGPSYAKRIVDYREKNGPFERVEDIMRVRGIGQKTFDANKDVLTVE